MRDLCIVFSNDIKGTGLQLFCKLKCAAKNEGSITKEGKHYFWTENERYVLALPSDIFDFKMAYIDCDSVDKREIMEVLYPCAESCCGDLVLRNIRSKIQSDTFKSKELISSLDSDKILKTKQNLTNSSKKTKELDSIQEKISEKEVFSKPMYVKLPHMIFTNDFERGLRIKDSLKFNWFQISDNVFKTDFGETWIIKMPKELKSTDWSSCIIDIKTVTEEEIESLIKPPCAFIGTFKVNQDDYIELWGDENELRRH